MRRTASVPVFQLYGESGPVRDAEFVHIEDIESRSAPRLWEIEAHLHRGLGQLVFLFDGGATALFDGRTVEVAPPAVLVVPPAAIHAFQFRPGTRGHVLTLAEGLLTGDAAATLFLEARAMPLAGGETAADLDALLGQLAREFRGDAPGRSVVVEALVRIILLRVARRHVRESAPAGAGRRRAELFARFRQLVEAHYREQWTLARYARELTMTEGRLNRLCRAVSGQPAAELVIERRMLEARRRLIYVAAPVSRIAYDLGYPDPAYFSRIFKRRVGMTPNAFRRQRQAGAPAGPEEAAVSAPLRGR